MAATQQPAIEEAWEEVCRRAECSTRHDSLSEVIDAAAESDTVFEVSRKVRMGRRRTLPVLSWFGLGEPGHGDGVTYPPEDLDERVEMLRSGQIPQDARAVADWGGPDE